MTQGVAQQHDEDIVAGRPDRLDHVAVPGREGHLDEPAGITKNIADQRRPEHVGLRRTRRDQQLARHLARHHGR